MAAPEIVAGYREIVVGRESLEKWKEIDMQTGVLTKEAQFPDSAGGYTYIESDYIKSVNRNRSIYWRTCFDVVELVEVSLDFNLEGNQLRLRFGGVPVINVTVQETNVGVVLLVSTVCSVHRLLFPHPTALQSHDVHHQTAEQTLQSIFSSTSIQRLEDVTNNYIYNGAAGGAAATASYHVITASSYVAVDGLATFAVALNGGGLLIIKMPPLGSQGSVTVREVKQQSIVSRLWSGLIPSIMRGGSDSNGETSTNLCLHSINNDVAVFAICRDSKLRMWSTNSFDCVLAADVLDHIPDNMDTGKTSPGVIHMIRKSVVQNNPQALNIAVYLSVGDKSTFVVYQLELDDAGRYHFHHVTTLFAPPENSLLDFVLTPTQLFGLWSNAAGETVSRCATFADDDNSRPIRWFNAIMLPPLKDQLELYRFSTLDPRELYLEQIFFPDRFGSLAILNALNILRKNPNANPLSNVNTPIRVLRQEVSQAVVAEIRQAATASGSELSEDDYVALQSQQWAQFYSNCVRYQQNALEAVGLFTDTETGLVAVVNKSTVSYLRPCDALERLYHDPPLDTRSAGCCVRTVPSIADDDQLCDDVLELIKCLKMINNLFDGEAAYCLDQDLYYGGDPLELAANFVTMLLRNSSDVTTELGNSLPTLAQPLRAAEVIVQLLDVTQLQVLDDAAVDDEGELDVASRLFASQSGVTILCAGVRQFVETRLEVARDLLVTLTLMRRLGIQRSPNVTSSQTFDATFVDLTTRLGFIIHSYYVVNWCSRSVALPANSSTLENTRKQLDSLRMLNTTAYPIALKLGDSNMTLLELFLRVRGGEAARELLTRAQLSDVDCFTYWTQSLPLLVSLTTQLVWPLYPGARFLFPQCLVGQCQFLAIQDYVRLTQAWCDLDTASRCFVLGQSYLHSSEPHKALECFLAAAHDIMSEDFLMNLMLNVSQDGDSKHIEVLYYLQVIHLFEQFDLAEFVVTLVNLAIGIAEDDDPNLATLWSKLFKFELDLGHTQKAYNAMLSNPDNTRRKDCLRQFLVVACDRNELELLIQLPYRDNDVVLEPEVVTILESRARSIPVSKHKYYELLYAFHIHRNNYRAAGSVMYEYSYRLAAAESGLKALQGQAKCLLAALNSLRLCDVANAWVVRRVAETGDNADDDDEVAVSPPKRGLFDIPDHSLSDLNYIPYKPRRQVEVLTVADLEKEYALVHASLELAQHSPVFRSKVAVVGVYGASGSRRADETVGLLVSAGLFDKAVSVCQLFGLKFDAIVEGLATRCVRMSRSMSYTVSAASPSTADLFTWLEHNELTAASCKESGSGAVDSAWRLLQAYVERYDDSSARYHRCVAIKLIQEAFTLPTWLTASYKRLKAAELLRLYLDYDLLTEATDLAIEYIKATLGAGKEYFGLQDYVHTGATAAWLPYTALDQLLFALQDVRTDPHYSQLYDDLEATLNKYFQAVESASPLAAFQRSGYNSPPPVVADATYRTLA